MGALDVLIRSGLLSLGQAVSRGIVVIDLTIRRIKRAQHVCNKTGRATCVFEYQRVGNPHEVEAANAAAPLLLFSGLLDLHHLPSAQAWLTSSA
jgi:hypothetical protein